MPIYLRFFWVTISCGVFSHASAVSGRDLPEARLTQVVRDVQVSDSSAAAAPATLNAAVREGSVLTGTDSRAEITFANQTVARVGDKSDFAVHAEKRGFDLNAGAVLVQVPKHARSTKIRIKSITASVTGATFLVENHPGAYIKFIVLDGTGRLCLKKPGQISDCMLLRAGQMVIVNPDAKGLPDAVDVDLDRLLKTCRLITEFSALPRQDLLTEAAAKQRRGKSHGAFVDTNLVIFGRGTLVSLLDPNASDQPAPHATPAAPTPASDSNAESTP